ncbi:MAG: polyribonucleotide nucleotidyltransferase [Firmicutes bacterium]|nr:polyribonucleotide nucleotidyltransferase [Bacillota bacterium]
MHLSERIEKFEFDFADRLLTVEIGKFAQLTNGSCFVKYGDTAVLVTATMAEEQRSGIDFFPLSVDFEERLYAVGKIPGSFLKREGRPSEKSILASRLIDRSLRPLFCDYLRNNVSIVCTVMSVSKDCSPEILSIIGSSIAVSISDIPWNGPISAVSVGLVNNKFIINPDAFQKSVSDLDLTVSSNSEKVIMIEAGANQISESKILESIIFGHNYNLNMINFIKEIKSKVGKPKIVIKPCEIDKEIEDYIKKLYESEIREAIFVFEKKERDNRVKFICEKIIQEMSVKYIDKIEDVKVCLHMLQKDTIRKSIVNFEKRVDGRGLNEIRKLSSEIGILPRTHGSALFSRGKTQVLTVVTLGPMSDNQTIDDISTEESKRYMHHYNFHSFSVGETRSSRAPNRREIGHGALAERALEFVIPKVKDFPYTIRLVSEVLSSNGSTSQASICSSTLALMDAGVPILEPVAGISCGLVVEDNKWKTFLDIQGIEDFFGDMDFKIAGTKNGITAMQVDMKIDGLTFDIIKDALTKTKDARIKILDDSILKSISHPRSVLSKYAPKVMTVMISVDKIRNLVGSGGKVIQKLCSEYKVKIDIENDGRIFVISSELDNCKLAIEKISNITRDIKIGDVIDGNVTRVMDFGIFVELAPGRDGMCHISKLSNNRIECITDIVNLGEKVKVEVINIDSKGRINLKKI